MTPGEAEALQDETQALLEAALSQVNALHLPGARTLHRERLARVLALTEEVLGTERDEAALSETSRMEAQLARALAQSAWAQDARHGAGQLSRSAQRAPSEEDCALGWQNVEAITCGAESAAAEVVHLAELLTRGGAKTRVERRLARRLEKASRLASAAAEEARRIIEDRNHAYTFHADPGFSFGEGWYVAAAGVLAGVQIQVESAQSQSAQARRFLQDAGLSEQVVPYRSRPRANKALPWLIADAFATDPGAQAKLRAAFLGDDPADDAIIDWADAALADVPRAQAKVLIWVRDCAHDANRNTATLELAELCRVASQRGLLPVLFGDTPAAPERLGSVDLTQCWRLPLFQGARMRRAQLELFERLGQAHGVVGQLGVTSAGMDGPALMGLPTMYITDKPNPRLGRWVGRVPGYEEVVRERAYLETIGEMLARWRQTRW